MKRIGTILLSLALVLALTAPGALAAEKSNANLLMQTNQNLAGDTPKYVTGAVGVGDTLYILTNQSLERWMPGDTESTPVLADFVNADYGDMSTEAETDAETETDEVAKVSFSQIFTDGAVLYGLNRELGTVWQLTDEADAMIAPKVAVQLDTSVFERTNSTEGYTYTPQFGDIVLMNGVLYQSLIDWEASGQNYELVSWSFATGELKEQKRGVALRTLSPYRDGLLLCKQFDDMNSWDEKTQTQIMPTLVTYNPATGEMNTLMTFDTTSIYGVRYDAASDTLYYVEGATVYALTALAPPARVSAYLPNRIWDDASVTLLSGGMLAVADYNGAIVRGLDMPGVEAGALTIYGEYGSAGHQAFIEQYPQLPVTTSEAYFTSLEDFTGAMVSASDAVDVLRLDSGYTPLARLIDKGYALELDAYPELAQIAAAMDPTMTALCTRDGKVYGLPVECYGTTLGYNAEVLGELGIREEDLPKTVMELLDFVANWQYDYGEDHPELMLFDNGRVREGLLNWMMENYVAYQTRENEPIAFDTPVFRALMEKLESMDMSDLDVPEEEQDEEYWSRQAVFSLYSNVTYPGQYRYDMKFLILPFAEGLEPAVPTSVTYMIINPRSQHISQAVTYMATYVQNLEAESAKIVMFPNNNEPVVNSRYESDLKSWQETLTEYQAMLTTAKPEEIAGLQDSIDYFQTMVDDAETYRYNVSTEEIAAYREQIAPYLVVTAQSPLQTWDAQGNNEFYTLRSQYLDGATTLDQFLKETDKRLRMMQMEDQ